MNSLSSRRLQRISLFLSLTALLSGCGEGFNSKPEGVADQPSTALSDPSNLKDFNLEILTGDFKPVVNTKSLREKVVYNFAVGIDDKLDSIITWSLEKNEAGCDLKVFSGNASASMTCTSDGGVIVQISALSPSGQETTSRTQGYVKGAGLVILPMAQVFSIPAGRGLTTDWNASTTNVNAQATYYVGQIVRIKNDDSVEHKPRVVGGNTPCELADITLKPLQSIDCVVSKEAAYGPLIQDALTTNNTGRFYFRTVDAGRVYVAKECNSCHGPKIGATLTGLNNALTNVNAMAAKYGTLPTTSPLFLSDADKRALIYYLNN